MRNHSLKYYLCENKKVHSTTDLFKWADYFETADRRVKEDTVGDYWVSTVFLGLDFGYTHDGPPLVFETMIFKDGDSLDYQDRYSTWDEAIAGHNRAIEWLKQVVKKMRYRDD